MADVIAAIGLMMIGAVGAASAMLALGFRQPGQHYRAILHAVHELERQLISLHSLLRGE